MRIKINSKTLLNAVLTASKAIPSKSQMPILEGFLFECNGSAVRITASDTQTTIVTSVPCEQAEGAAVIPASTFIDSLRSLPDVDIVLSSEGSSMSISYGFGSHEMPVWDISDYPSIPEPEGAKLTISGHALADGIAHVQNCVGNDGSRPVMSGVCFTGVYGGMELCASDSRVLTKILIPTTEGGEYQFIIPANALKTVRDIAPGADVEITNGESAAMFKVGATSVITQKIQGRFPKYAELFSQHTDKSLEVEKSDFLRILRRVVICAEKTSGHLKFEMKEGLDASVSSCDLTCQTSAQERFSCEYTGEDLIIGLKQPNLEKVLAPLNDGKIILRFSDNRHAVYVEGRNDTAKSLIMPVQI